MKVWQLSCVVGAMTALIVAGIDQIAAMRQGVMLPIPIAEATADAAANSTIVERFDSEAASIAPNTIVDAAFRAAGFNIQASPDVTDGLSQGRVLAYVEDDDQASAEPDGTRASDDHSVSIDTTDAAKRELPYLRYYVYSETPPPEKPAKIAEQALSDVPLGTPTEEIKRAADAFGLDPNFLKAVAKIESDFDPTERTGSYIGLFQLSRAEFKRYGSGDILNARDNALAAGDKFLTEAVLFEAMTEKKPTISDLYLIHQQGWQGAAEHVAHPDWIAWKSMCATDEGRQKGEHWCKRAIWGNTLPSVKREWKSVNRLTSAAFVAMWRERIDNLYARYADAGVQQAKE
jgi:Transglycosylase SLT domain